MEDGRAKEGELKFPGLKWRTRKGERRIPVWVASDTARLAGYPVKTANLQSLADNPLLLARRCDRLQSEMLLWLSGRRSSRAVFDGTWFTLIEIYLTDPESKFHKLKPSSRYPYEFYARKVQAHIGELRIDACDGRDLRRWFDEVWSVPAAEGKPRKIPAARMALTVVKEAVSFGVVSRLPGCAEWAAILAEMEFPTQKRRRFAPTPEEVTALCEAAHAAGRPSSALAYALIFESTLRLWDVIGEWIPLSDPRPSPVLGPNGKWIGPSWAQIDAHDVFRLTPGKTEDTTEVEGEFDLSLYPRTMQEIARVPAADRTGPLIKDPVTGLPFDHQRWRRCWRADAKAAGIANADKVWSRDLRAGAITDARKKNAPLPDVSKGAGHTNLRTTARVYDRDFVEAARRVARVRFGGKEPDGGGT